MSKIFKKALASACAITAIITSGVVTSFTASANNSSDTSFVTTKNNNSCFKYDTNKSRYKLDDSCIYVNNNANGNYDSVDLRVSVWAHIYHYASSTYQDFSPASRNGKIALVGAVRIPKKEKKFIYQYVYENGTDIAVNNGWSQNSYRIYADLLIQSGEDKATAGLWSPDSVGWYPAAEPYDKWCG